MVNKLSELLGLSNRHIRSLIPEEYKDISKRHKGMRKSFPHSRDKSSLCVGCEYKKIAELKSKPIEKTEIIDNLLNWLDKEEPKITDTEAKFLRALKEVINKVKIIKYKGE
jgi:hypothetical protein